MKTAELVRKLLDAGAAAEAVEIALTAVEEAVEEEAQRHRPRAHRRKPETPKIVATR